MFVSTASGVATIDDAKKKTLSMGASGASSPSVLYPQVSNNLLGTKFKIVPGYSSGSDINLAVEQVGLRPSPKVTQHKGNIDLQVSKIGNKIARLAARP